MPLYKAKHSYKTANNKYFGVHKVQILEQGGSIEITDFKGLPESVKGHLEPLEKKKTKKKKETK